MNEAKVPTTENNKFVANGKVYMIDNSLTVERYQEFEKLEAHVGFGIDFEQMAKTLTELYNKLNEMKFVESAVMVHNMLNGILRKKNNETHPMLYLCCLFINREYEDRTSANYELFEEKINDWKTEGIAMEFFFQLALKLVRNYATICNEVSDITSGKTKAKQNTTKEK